MREDVRGQRSNTNKGPGAKKIRACSKESKSVGRGEELGREVDEMRREAGREQRIAVSRP